MPIALPYQRLSDRFAAVRAWGKKAFPSINKCAVCMSYALQVEPNKAAGDVTLADLPGTRAAVESAFPVPPGPGLHPNFLDMFFIRAAELLPRVVAKFGPADVEGAGTQVWPNVEGKKGVLYLEDCYQTSGDESAAKWTNWMGKFGGEYLAQTAWTNGDHWDLFDGAVMVADGSPIRNNKHSAKLYFWQAG